MPDQHTVWQNWMNNTEDVDVPSQKNSPSFLLPEDNADRDNHRTKMIHCIHWKKPRQATPASQYFHKSGSSPVLYVGRLQNGGVQII
jgi:hypothetical protein